MSARYEISMALAFATVVGLTFKYKSSQEKKRESEFLAKYKAHCEVKDREIMEELVQQAKAELDGSGDADE